MAPASKGKGKGREARPSRSRNTTPSSSFSSGPNIVVPSVSYLENDPSKLLIPTSQYAEILDHMGGTGPIPDSKSLESLVEHLKSLSQMADARGDTCNMGIRELSRKRKDVGEEPEPIDREATRMKREIDEDDDVVQPTKGGKLKKRKERGGSVKEERPLNHGAHELSRQDGAETKIEGAASPASKKSKNAASEGTSSLSPPSPASPILAATNTTAFEPPAAAGSPTSDHTAESHQPEPAPTVSQVQVFGPNPLKFDDPTIYHIREVTPEMTDEEKKEVYSVAVFPHDDLRDKMAGTPPNKDFSNAKPANQVSANTFQAYIEPFVRPLMEEDMAWLKEKGDRVTPFIMPPRGKKHYKDIWSEEDGALGVDRSNSDDDRLPLNQGRGTIEQITDDTAETDQVSVGPMVSRLYSLLRYEHRAPAEEGSTNGAVNGESSTNGAAPNGDSMEIDQPPAEPENKSLPSATAFPDASPTGFKVPAARLDHAQLDERLKAELRHVGFIGADDNPEYDAHYDDDIAQRLRLLQSELKKQIIINNARKARMLEIARERMAYQEYTTIHDDLDTQVQHAYLKRSRTLGKSKKGSQAKNRPGAGAAGGAGNHVATAAGVSRPAIGDVARTLMDRRKRWEDCIGPVFRESKTTVPGRGETVFDPVVMTDYEKAEVEGWDEEQE